MTTRPFRALVVDDERGIRESIRDALVAGGIPCELAARGDEALKAAEHPGIGVLLLDVTLPDRSAAEVQETILRRRPALRVIALGAQQDQARILEALRGGAADYLAKPVHAEELRLAVRRALEGYGLESRWQSLRGRLHLLGAQLSQLHPLKGDEDPTSTQDLYRPVVETVAEVLAATKASLLLADPGGSTLRPVAALGADLPVADLDPAMVGESVAGLAFESDHAMLIDDIETDPRCAPRTKRARYRTASVALAPLVGPRGPFGVLCATDREGTQGFADEDLALLRILAIQVAGRLAFDPAPSAESPGDPEGAVCLDLARSICEAVTEELEPERILMRALRPVAAALEASPVSIHLIDGSTGALGLEAQHDPGGVSDRERLPRDAGLTGTVMQSGRLVAADRPDADPRYDAGVDTPADGIPRPLIAVPLRLRGKVLGVARLFPSPATGASARVGEVLAPALSAAIRNVLLYRSLLDSIEDVARARRAAGHGEG